MHWYQIIDLTISSDLEIPGLRPAAAAGEPSIEIRWARIEAADLLERPTGIAWRADPGALILGVRGVGVYRVTGGSRIEIDAATGARRRDLVLFLLGSAMGALWHQRGVLALHASAVLTGPTSGRCAAFAGPSGIGKSTLVAFLHRQGHALVADDVSLIDGSGGRTAVWPGFRRLKLWRDGLSELGEDPAALERAGGRREKYHLDVEGEAETQNTSPVPLGTLYELADGDALAIEPVTGLDAVDVVERQTYRRDFVAAMGLQAPHFTRCAAFAGSVAIRRLVRPRGFEHMEAVLDVLRQDWSETAVRRGSP